MLLVVNGISTYHLLYFPLTQHPIPVQATHHIFLLMKRHTAMGRNWREEWTLFFAWFAHIVDNPLLPTAVDGLWTIFPDIQHYQVLSPCITDNLMKGETLPLFAPHYPCCEDPRDGSPGFVPLRSLI
ncbi:hypothetical protein LDENG_00022070 [Lucifuga dentata]|nr:hypothetical protein LDENG_00022070 [Lucifuga dentata]